MNNWDGVSERRKVSVEFEFLKGQLALLNEKIENYTKLSESQHKDLKSIIEKHEHTIFGNGQEGMKTKLDKLKNSHRDHIIVDRWIYGFVISSQLGIIGIILQILGVFKEHA